MPRRVTVGPHVVRVLADDVDAVNRLRHEGDRGRCDMQALTIQVDEPGLAPSAAAEALLHEVLHAVTEVAGLTAVDGIDERLEAVVTAMAPTLLGVIRANPTLIEYLVEAR